MMPSYETEGIVAKMLIALSEGERSVEISRQVLCDNFDFDAYQVFREMDLVGKNKIDALDIIDFLKRRSIYTSHCDAEFIVQFYDLDGDHALNYSEFLNMVKSSNSFKKAISQAICGYLLMYSMGKFLEKEMNLAKDLSMSIDKVKQRYDFNVHEIFHSLKSWNEITVESMKHFLDKHGIRYLDSDVKAIMKRLDINNDGTVDLKEFSSFFKCPLHCGHCPCCCCTCCHYHSVSFCSRENSPLRSSSPLLNSQSLDKAKQDCGINKQMGMSMPNGFKPTYQTDTPDQNKRTNPYSPEVKRVSPNLSL